MRKSGRLLVIPLIVLTLCSLALGETDRADRDRDRFGGGRGGDRRGGDHSTHSINQVNNYLVMTLKVDDPAEFNYTLYFKKYVPYADKFFSPHSAPVIAKILRSLCRDMMNNPLVVGAPGVGKSFLKNQLAAILSYGIIPEFMKQEMELNDPALKAFIKNTEIININNVLLSKNPTKPGMPYLDQELRMNEILSGIFAAAEAEHKSSGKRFLFIFDEAGTLPPSVQDNLKLLLDRTGFKDPNDPLESLSDSGVSIMAMTTPEEARRMTSGDAAKEGRYVRIELPEPPREVALSILSDKAQKLTKKHNVVIDDGVLEAMVRKSALLNYPPIAMPRSILTGIDDLILQIIDKKRGEDIKTVTMRDFDEFLIKKVGLTDVWLEGPNGEPPFHDLAERVKKLVIGQDEVVDKIAQVIKTWARLDFGGDVPVFYLGGSSGSGKDTLVQAFSKVMFGHTSSHLTNSISGIGGFGMEALLEGPPVGNHSDSEPPILVKQMENGASAGFFVFNEGKDAHAQEHTKLKVPVEQGQLRPRGMDSRARPIRFPIFVLGQWGEELFDGKDDEFIDNEYKHITQEEIDNVFMYPNTNDGTGAVPYAVLQRAKKAGGVFLLKPVAKDRYVDIIKIHVAEFINDEQIKNRNEVEVTIDLMKFIAQHTIDSGQGTRALSATIKDFTQSAMSAAADQGMKYKQAKIKLDYVNGKISVSSLDAKGKAAEQHDFLPALLVRTKISCDQLLAQKSGKKP